MTAQENGAKPGEKLTAPAVTRQASPSLDEGFPSQDFSLNRLPAKKHCLPHQSFFMTSAEITKSVGVSPSRPGQEIRNGLLMLDVHEC
jgi:hypothetical protein